MRKNILILVVFLTIGFLVNCSGYIRNEFLGEVPSIEKDYYNKIAKKEKAMEECTDIAEAFKLEKELKKIKKERSAKIKEYVAANPLTKPLPFEGLTGTAYTVKEVKLNVNLNPRFSLKIDKDIKNKYGGIERRLFLYYKAVDNNGKEIPGTRSVATSFGTTVLKAGTEYNISSSWNMTELEDFAKVVEITEQEYKQR